MNSDYLMHHGVKGMKWGVRKQLEKVGKVLNKQVTSKETDAKIKKATIALGAAAATAALAAVGASPALSLSGAVIEGGRKIVTNAIGARGPNQFMPPTPYGQRFNRLTTPQYIYRNRG